MKILPINRSGIFIVCFMFLSPTHKNRIRAIYYKCKAQVKRINSENPNTLARALREFWFQLAKIGENSAKRQ
jgi:hypothetical protein